MKFILFYCENRYRSSTNSKCININRSEDVFLLSTNSSVIINLFLFFFKKKTIIFGCDGKKPKLLFKHKIINLWFNTQLELLENNFDKNIVENKNNLFICKNNLFKEAKNFLLTPVSKSKYFDMNKKIKIIYVSEVHNNISTEVKNFWNLNKITILGNLSLLDEEKFILKIPGNDKFQKIKNYMEIKNLLRLEIITILYNKFKDNMILVGPDWKKIGFKAIESEHDISLKKKLYRGNICLDLGAKSGGNFLYPRSVEILENNGYLLQIKPMDMIEDEFENYKTFTSISHLIFIIEKLLNQSGEKINCGHLNQFLNSRFNKFINELF